MKNSKKTILTILAVLAVVAVALFFLTGKDNTQTNNPTEAPLETPTVEPTKEPIAEPTEAPVVEPTEEPVIEPTIEPTVEPTETPVVEPTAEPNVEPTKAPTPTVAPTATPVPTVTPTPVPTSTPTPTVKPYCSHKETATFQVGETDTEYINEVACLNCGEVIREFTTPKATPTPTPKPTAKPTEKPLPTPTPVVDKEIEEEFFSALSHTIIYTDRTKTTTVFEYGLLPKNATLVSYIRNYEDINTLVAEDIIMKFEHKTQRDEVVLYCLHQHYDGKTDTWTTRLVNTDGSYNRYSADVIEGEARINGTVYGPNGIKRITYGETYNGTYIIYPEDFISHENGVIRLYDY